MGAQERLPGIKVDLEVTVRQDFSEDGRIIKGEKALSIIGVLK